MAGNFRCADFMVQAIESAYHMVAFVASCSLDSSAYLPKRHNNL